jgi:PAS domain S-box-containing protein
MEALRQASAAHVLGLRGLVEKHDFLPHAAARHPEVQHLLRTPGDAALRSRVNNYFADLQTTTGAAALYLVDRNGMTLASSNWNTPSSFVGESYRQRPYLKMRSGGRGLFYGLGLTTGQAGLFIAEPVRVGAAMLGVAVVKISLDPLERVWQRSGYPVVLRDSRGVVFLSAVPEWLFHSIAPVSAADSKWISEHGQYGTRARFDRCRGKSRPARIRPASPCKPRCTAAAPAARAGYPAAGTGLDPHRHRRHARSTRHELALALSTWPPPCCCWPAVLALAGTPLCRAAGGPAGTGTTRGRTHPRPARSPYLRKAMEDSLLVGMRARDPEGRIIYVNPAFCAMVGYSAEELLGRLRPIRTGIRMIWKNRPGKRGRAAGPRRAACFESRIRHKDGHDVITMIYTAPLVDAVA